jgi:hypothetical protein
MINSGGALTHVGPLELTTTITNSTSGDDAGDGLWRQTTTAEIEIRGPGSFVAYATKPSRIMVQVDGSSTMPYRLDFSYNQENKLLEFMLPTEANEGRPHQVTVVWDK